MNIGELFVKLGIQGGEKTLNTLKDNQKAFKGTASMALEAKAAILGAAYAFQNLMSTSNRAGSELTNFSSSIGVSAQTLQRYQYAARQVGVDNKAVEASFRGLQQTMTKTLMGEGAPKGLARVAQLTGDITPEDILAFSKSPEKLLQRLQEYAAQEKDAGFRNEVLKSFGLGDDMVAALSRKAFRPEVLSKAPVYSDKEIAALDKANVAWSNLGDKIEKAFGRFNAKYGNQLVGDLTKIVDKVVALAEAFVELADKAKVFETIGMAIEGWTLIFQELKTLVDWLIANIPKLWESGKSFFTDEIPNAFRELLKQVDVDVKRAELPPMFGQKQASIYDEKYQPKELVEKRRAEKEERKNAARVPSTVELMARNFNAADLVMPKIPEPIVNLTMPPAPQAARNAGAQPVSQNITVQQTLRFEGADGVDPERAKRIHAEAVQRAYRQIPAQGRIN